MKKNLPKSLIDLNTKTFINVIKKNPVDIITHVNFCCFADAVEVAKAAADYGTYIELNAKKTHLTDDELYEIEKTGVNFIIGSDAHAPERVGEISLVEQTLKRVCISEDRIVNINGKTVPIQIDKNGVIFAVDRGMPNASVPLITGFPFESISEGMRLNGKLRPLMEQIAEIQSTNPEYFSVFLP